MGERTGEGRTDGGNWGGQSKRRVMRARGAEEGSGEGEIETEWAMRSSCYQSIGRFSPCFFVNSSAFFKNFLRSFEYSSAKSALRGCSG